MNISLVLGLAANWLKHLDFDFHLECQKEERRF
jgi:hypothetical protein